MKQVSLMGRSNLHGKRAAESFMGTGCPNRFAPPRGMKYVYFIRSLAARGQRYVGVTSNLQERLRAHDIGASPHTSKYRPWELVTYVCFTDDQRVLEFERYLKSGSGHAFAKKRLW